MRRHAPLWLTVIALGIGSVVAEPRSGFASPETEVAGQAPTSPSAPSMAVPGLAGTAFALVTERAGGTGGRPGSRERWTRHDLPDRPSLIARPDVHARHPDHRASDALARGGALSAPSTAPPALRSA